MNIDRTLLPQILQQIAELIDLADTMKLVEKFGGVRLYIPMKLGAEHQLVDLIGDKNAEKLATAFGGETLEIPKAEAALREIRNQEIREQWPKLSHRQLALKYGTTDRNIRKILGEVRDERQLEIFFETEENHELSSTR